jgi:M6 family metalloprotease-like protein
MSRRTVLRTGLVVAALCCLTSLGEASRPRTIGGDPPPDPGKGDPTRAERVSALTAEALNLLAEIETAAPGAAAALKTRGRMLLQERRSEFEPLIDENPGGAIASALDTESVERLAAVIPDARPDLETVGRFQGIAEVLIADDFERGKSETIVTIALGERRVRVQFSGAKPEGLASGTMLAVDGVLMGDRVAASSGEILAGAGAAAALSAPACSTLGDQPTAVVLVNMPGATLPPYLTPENVRNFFFGTDGGKSLDGYWREASYGLASASGGVFGPYMLGQDYNCDQTYAMRVTAILAADADVDFRNYNRIFIIFPRVSSCNFTGLGELSCGLLSSPGDGSFIASTSWFDGTTWANHNAPRDLGVFVAAHEGGHNLGLQHSFWRSFSGEPLGVPGSQPADSEYTDPFSAMGRPNAGHYAAPHKLRLGWLDPATHVRTVTTSGTYPILPYEVPSSGIKALKVQRGAEQEWLWLESRTNQSAYDCQPGTLLNCNGALVHYDVPFSTATYLLDFTPTSGFFVNDAPIPAGTTWFDPYTGLSLTPTYGAGVLDVAANYGPRTCHRPPTVQVLPAGQSVSNNAGVSFTVTVTNVDEATCPGATYVLSSTPVGWSGRFTPASLSIPPGASANSTLAMTVPRSTEAGIQTVTASAAWTTVTGTGTQTVNVVSNCVLGDPIVNILPDTQSVAVNETANFTFEIDSTDSAGCGSHRFDISSALPAGWSGQITPSFINLTGNGSVGTVQMRKFIPAGTPIGSTHTVDATATSRPGTPPAVPRVGSDTAALTIAEPCVHANPMLTAVPAAQIAPVGDSPFFQGFVRNNDSPTCAPVTFTIVVTGPSGWPVYPESDCIPPCPPTVQVPPGQTRDVWFGATPPGGTAPGAYGVTLTANAPGQSGSTSVIVGVNPVCVPVNPTVVLSPASAPAAAGQPASFTATVTNNDVGSTCAASTFALSAAVPSGWNASLAPSVSVAPGGSVAVPFQTTSPITTATGPYPVSVTASSGGRSGIGGANVQVAAVYPRTTLEAGYAHSISAHSDGTVFAWGLNASGQLGDSTLVDRRLPVRAGTLTGAIEVGAGVFHSVALKSDGTVWAWGGNSEGQLGDGTTVQRAFPGQVPGLAGIVAIASGFSHTVALKSDGTVWTWGDNWGGQIGDGATTDRLAPFQVPGLSGVAAVGAGAFHSVAVKHDGTVWTWGRNATGELGDGTHTDRFYPGPVPGLGGVTRISCGAYFNMVVLSDGTMKGWGHNFFGQLGDGTTVERTTPVSVAGLTSVVEVAAGSAFTLALRADGSVWAFGQNVFGQLGDGTLTHRSLPQPVPGLAGIVDVAAGEDHSLARTASGLVYGWGKNLNGQVGPGPNPQTTPIVVTDESQPAWLTMTVDATTAVTGEFASIALDPWGRTGIAYTDRTNGDLKFALRTGGGWGGGAGWSIETVDTVNATGWYTSLAFGADGSPRIAYMDGTRTYLRYAAKSGSVWTREDVANTNCTLPTSLAFDTADRPFIAIQDCSSTQVRVYARSGPFSGPWSLLRSQSGASPSLRMSGNLPRISYFLHSSNPTQLRYLSASGSYPSFTWTDEAVTGGGGANESSLALDTQGNPRIAFYAANTTSLRLAKKDAGAWSVEVVDASGGDVGRWNSIGLDGSARPRISYLANGLVKLAAWSGTAWVFQTVDSSGSPAATALAVDAAGNNRIAYFDTPGGDLRYAISQPDITPPATPALTLDAGRTTIVVSWTAPGDDGAAGQAAHYELRRSAAPIDEGNFAQATVVPHGPPGPPGTTECGDVQSLPSCAPHYFALRVYDDLGNPSGLATGQISTDCSGSMELLCG